MIRPAPRHPAQVAAFVAAVCLLLTTIATWATARVDRNAEHRLLQVQTEQAAAVLSTAVLLIQQPLTTSLQAQEVAGTGGDGPAFRQSMSGSVGPDRLFTSASLWRRHGSTLTRVANLGSRPALVQQDRHDYLLRAFTRDAFTVRAVRAGDRALIAYAVADRATGFVVYAERPIPSDRRAPVDKNAAFSDLHYAIYLGKSTALADLSTTDVDPADLPFSGRTAHVEVPFGDSTLTLVTSARRHLGSSLGQRLPLFLLVGGLVITAFASRAALQLARGRQQAEAGAATITELYERVEQSYGQQRDVFERLQRALLPHEIPAIPNLEVAAEYVAGAVGVDIGGDWYSLIGQGEDEFGFVVGDVSGRGIEAVAVMAHARFTVRAYLLDGDGPAEALEKCSHQFDIISDGHLTTLVVGVGNWRTGEFTLASAGHPAPLLISADGARFLEVSPGRPLGTGPSSYRTTSFFMPPGGTLLCFTDGLVERRTEDIDTGMERLARAAAPLVDLSVDELVREVLVAQRAADDNADDVAVLAVRWAPRR